MIVFLKTDPTVGIRAQIARAQVQPGAVQAQSRCSQVQPVQSSGCSESRKQPLFSAKKNPLFSSNPFGGTSCLPDSSSPIPSTQSLRACEGGKRSNSLQQRNASKQRHRPLRRRRQRRAGRGRTGSSPCGSSRGQSSAQKQQQFCLLMTAPKQILSCWRGRHSGQQHTPTRRWRSWRKHARWAVAAYTTFTGTTTVELRFLRLLVEVVPGDHVHL